MDVYHRHYLFDESEDSTIHPSETAAMANTRHAIENDFAMSRAQGDTESMAAERTVFEARRTLYLRAVRNPEAREVGTSEWGWNDGHRDRGLLLLEQDETGWRIHEEHFWVSDGPCEP